MGDQSTGSQTGWNIATAVGAADVDAQENIAVAVDSAATMNKYANEGQLSLDPATGQQVLKALSDHIDQVTQWKQTASGLSGPLPMGNNWVGQSMADKFSGRANGDSGSQGAALSPTLDQYHSALLEAHQAVSTAIANYQATEEQIGDQMKSLTSDLPTVQGRTA